VNAIVATVATMGIVQGITPDATKQTLYGAILLIAVATYAATQHGGFRRSGG
jgi:hypothetical protein